MWCGQDVASTVVSIPWHLWWTQHQQNHDFKVQIIEKITNLPRPDNPTINWLQNHFILSIYQDINQQPRKILILNPTTTLDEMRATPDPRNPLRSWQRSLPTDEMSATLDNKAEKPTYRWDESYPGQWSREAIKQNTQVTSQPKTIFHLMLESDRKKPILWDCWITEIKYLQYTTVQ